MTALVAPGYRVACAVMNINGKPWRTIWAGDDGRSVEVIDQTALPHRLATARLTSVKEAAQAIKTMTVRGAPLIGATAAYAMALAVREDPSDAMLARAHETLLATRPTAVNLRWAIDQMRAVLDPLPQGKRASAAYARAAAICDEDVSLCRAIGEHGLALVQQAWERRGKQGRVNILTHCNAGWLATVDWGTALAPVYLAFNSGLPVHVWVEETRPRNQGASLTAWELGQHGVPHTIIVDNAGGHLMQHGLVDLCLVGTDRTTRTGDVANKIGTYLKALAAHDNRVPFYAAVPGHSIDWTLTDGVREIPIEERDSREVSEMSGRTQSGALATVTITPQGSPAANYGFDVTPARLVTGLITERGVCPASEVDLRGLYPEKL